jgi:hypothetical protein
MAQCGWCAAEYDVPAVFHVCTDGTTFSERLRKTSAELAEERARKDRYREGYKSLGNDPPSAALIPRNSQGLPDQPNTVGRGFNWTTDDLILAKKLKIKI